MSGAIGMPSIAELERAYPGEWLAIEVHREDADGNPEEGELMYHGPDPEEAAHQMHRTPRLVYVLFSGPIRPMVHVGFL